MKTEILVVTDRSGSMSTIRNDVIGGYNTFIADQKTVAGEARVTFTQFDDIYEVVYAGRPLSDVPKLTSETFQPRGSTALYDAIGRTLNEQGARIAADKWADLVIVVVITDGGENASKEYQLPRIKEMTAHAEKTGWKFVYLAANQNAFDAATGLGLKGATTATYGANVQGASAAYASASYSTRSLRGGGDGSLSADLQKKLNESLKATL